MFNRLIKEKAKRGRRLLLMDSYSSHINIRFINYVDTNRIILVVLLLYLTYRL
jgi:hypothetical protein